MSGRYKKILVSGGLVIITMNSMVYATQLESTKFSNVESEILQCGGKDIQILSSCFDKDVNILDRGSSGNMRNQCKNTRLIIKGKETLIEKKYPFISLWQLKEVEKRGYKVNEIIDLSIKNPYSPMSISCIFYRKNPYILISYLISPGILKYGDYNHKLDYLMDNPIIMNLDGSYTSKKISYKINQMKKKKQIDNYKSIDANLIFIPER
nr:hypothetical protein [uncultured Neisseria sp.]